MDDCLKSNEGLKIHFICTEDPAKALTLLPKQETGAAKNNQQSSNMDDVDMRIVYPKSMPTYLRIDKDIKEALIQVARLSKDYASFNIEELEWKMQRKLEIELDRQSVTYKNHKQEVAKQISRVNEQLALCLQLKDSCVETRLQKHDVICGLIDETNRFKAKEDLDAKAIMA